MEIHEYFVTFGVQYGRRPGDDVHPLGMYADGYAVIEAPDMETARAMAFAIFDDKYAFIYGQAPQERHVPEGELLRICWKVPTFHNTGIVPPFITDRIPGHEDDQAPGTDPVEPKGTPGGVQG
jgi:hypothetical protein